MPEYDEFAGTYQHWSATATPYSAVETYSFFNVLGSVRGLDILDLATGEGRTARMLMRGGARTVLGCDISPEMVRRATEQNVPGSDQQAWPGLRYQVLDARDDAFQLDSPADAVTAMYLFHYAPSEGDLERMTRLIARNLKPGGRFATYTISPDYDFSRAEPRLMEQLGFDYAVVEGPIASSSLVRSGSISGNGVARSTRGVFAGPVSPKSAGIPLRRRPIGPKSQARSAGTRRTPAAPW